MDRAFLEAFALTCAVCFVYAGLLRLAQRFLRKGRASFTDENPAHRLYAALQTVSVLWVGASVAHQCAQGQDLVHDAGWAFAFGGIGFIMLLVAGQLGVRLLLGARLAEEIDEGNTAGALAAGGHFVAVAILVAESAAGTDVFGLGLALSFFAIGIVAQQGIVALFRALTVYDDAEQIAGENMAAALSYAGTSVAAAIVISRGLSGDFEGWEVSLKGFAQVAALGLLLLPIRQFVVGSIILGKAPRLRGGALDDAIGLRHDTAVAALDAVVAIAAAFAIARLA
jgi:uncharacterized membrane protein YjfL (UPF0719 family)